MFGNISGKLLVIVTVLFMIWAAQAFAGNGTGSGEFLKIPVYSRGSSMSGAFVALAEGTGALFYNPAGIGSGGLSEFSVSHSELYQGLRLENISLVLPLGNGYGFGLAATYLGYGDIAGYDLAGNSTGKLSAYSTVVTIGFSQVLSESVSWGLAVKPVFEELGGYSARTFAFDIGLAANMGRFAIGAQYANIGAGLRYIAEKSPLPRMIRIGAAYRSLDGTSTVSLAAINEADDDICLAGGIEYQYTSCLVFRAGYSGSLTGSVGAAAASFGVGLNFKPICLDYAYRSCSELEANHQITAGSILVGKERLPTEK